MMIVNPAAMGIPAAQANGTPIAWTRIFIGNVFPLAQLGNTTVFAAATNEPGYLATLPYTPTLPDFSASLRFSDFQAGTAYIEGSVSPSAADLSRSHLYADFSIPSAWTGYVPAAANPQTPRIFFDQTGAYG